MKYTSTVLMFQGHIAAFEDLMKGTTKSMWACWQDVSMGNISIGKELGGKCNPTTCRTNDQSVWICTLTYLQLIKVYFLCHTLHRQCYEIITNLMKTVVGVPNVEYMFCGILFTLSPNLMRSGGILKWCSTGSCLVDCVLSAHHLADIPGAIKPHAFFFFFIYLFPVHSFSILNKSHF